MNYIVEDHFINFDNWLKNNLVEDLVEDLVFTCCQYNRLTMLRQIYFRYKGDITMLKNYIGCIYQSVILGFSDIVIQLFSMSSQPYKSDKKLIKHLYRLNKKNKNNKLISRYLKRLLTFMNQNILK